MRHEKFSPGLLLAVQDYVHEGLEALMTHKRSLGIMASKSIVKPTKSLVFIYCDDNADLSHLAQYGIEVNQNTGNVRTAFLPIDSLDALSEEPDIQRIKPSRKLKLRMDVACQAVKLPEFKNKTGLTGKGVIIGIVDSGIDPKHPAFAGRILRLWDQTLPGPGVKEGAYGAELTDSLLSVSQDTDGHGTHVAGIASGADSTYGGVAPDAELIIIKSDLQDAHIADAVRYIFRIASELGRPAVVNLSIGGHADAHDGTDSLSKVIDSETGPGKIVCCAAGNEGNDNIHGQAKIASGRMKGIRFNVPLSQVNIVWMNAWYSKDSQLEVSLRSPNGFVTPFQKIITDGNPAVDHQLPDARVQIVTPKPDAANGDHNFFVQIRGNGPSPVMGGIWQLRVRNTSSQDTRLDVWMLEDTCSVLFTGTSVKDAVKIGAPGCASSAVTVAAYTTKCKYTDIDSQVREMGMEANCISEFSSEGPLRNDVQKPDVAAPGAMVVSALSSNANCDRSMTVNSKFMAMAGSSMATPFVTGIVALLLQRDRNLDPTAVKEILRKNSSIPGKPAGTFDNKWGYGLINTENL
ncbi:S8 family peptidase [Nostoc sp. FACHB-152]|uniref:S8 family peptidase n=1 Tax=unclassified Nostoc TaxID=2593658 RepID=UPI00168741AE|nr:MULTISPECIES: S8 family peptidase [unclassified Nostoc]MBD2447899.1 S8 family peptidase [Nostoc sp. FACHB-152]MBD2468527.1 S8 family peptidase [Nostoc sp. FACHB-145]